MILSEQKNLLRKQLKQKITSLSASACRESDLAILKQVTELEEYIYAQTVFCYVGTADEINTIPIIADALKRGKQVAVPKCISKGYMEAYILQDLSVLEPGKFGLMEPVNGTTMMPKNTIEMALIPCLTCNRKGQRLGYGGGYYDRYLQDAKCLKTVLCRAQLMSVEIPVERHDRIMDIVISETEVIRI